MENELAPNEVLSALRELELLAIQAHSRPSAQVKHSVIVDLLVGSHIEAGRSVVD